MKNLTWDSTVIDGNYNNDTHTVLCQINQYNNGGVLSVSQIFSDYVNLSAIPTTWEIEIISTKGCKIGDYITGSSPLYTYAKIGGLKGRTVSFAVGLGRNTSGNFSTLTFENNCYFQFSNGDTAIVKLIFNQNAIQVDTDV